MPGSRGLVLAAVADAAPDRKATSSSALAIPFATVRFRTSPASRPSRRTASAPRAPRHAPSTATAVVARG